MIRQLARAALSAVLVFALAACGSGIDELELRELATGAFGEPSSSAGRSATWTLEDPREQVAQRLRSVAEPRDVRSTGPVTVLQYARTIATVEERSGGSTLYVEPYEDGYRRHRNVPLIIGGWSSRPRTGGFGSGSGGGFRGGGPSSGK